MSENLYEPSSFNELYPGRFLNAADLGKNRPVVTIEKVTIDVLDGEKGPQEKVIVSFVGKKKAYVLPKINAISLARMFGNDIRAWRGKRIVLYVTAELMALRREPCIRIWGSPDIASDIKVAWKPSRRSEVTWTLHATGNAPQAQPDPEPFFDVPDAAQE